ncbi:twin-arginine translocase subunit TatB [Haematospirillum sp. H1815]|uniref:Sec-independent protein translocase protein TatB n=1 Tax=Haematospirillum sp. H1815 TaxID=2723108 RepID=UPI00143B6936|nr:Sec-independent protein translocase protein TatB [Haematospirillum sp. H1815]NKD76486.1 twin-arginine translocase subunit TatB [Haematospirillum sp. H1815]
MFDLAWSEIFLVGVVAALVLGPREIPGAMHAFARLVQKFRAVSREFRRHVDDMIYNAEITDMQEKARQMRRQILDPEEEKNSTLPGKKSPPSGEAEI